MPALTDDAWTHIRYDYEHTSRTIADICAEHGISDGTLRDRVAALALDAPPREIEQTARALGTLTRTLRELNALLAQQPRAAVPYDDMPEDLDAFRNELARQIDALLASPADEDFEDAPAGKGGEVGAAGEATSRVR